MHYFEAAPWAYTVMKVTGGCYLIYIGLRLFLNSNKVQGEESTLTSANAKSSAFWMRVVTTLTNPKSALFTASVFATVLPSHPSLKLGLLATIVMVGISLSGMALLHVYLQRRASQGHIAVDVAA